MQLLLVQWQPRGEHCFPDAMTCLVRAGSSTANVILCSTGRQFAIPSQLRTLHIGRQGSRDHIGPKIVWEAFKQYQFEWIHSLPATHQGHTPWSLLRYCVPGKPELIAKTSSQCCYKVADCSWLAAGRLPATCDC